MSCRSGREVNTPYLFTAVVKAAHTAGSSLALSPFRPGRVGARLLTRWGHQTTISEFSPPLEKRGTGGPQNSDSTSLGRVHRIPRSGGGALGWIRHLTGVPRHGHRAARTRRPQKSAPSRTSLVAPTSRTERGRGQPAGSLPIRLVLRPVIPDRPPP